MVVRSGRLSVAGACAGSAAVWRRGRAILADCILCYQMDLNLVKSGGSPRRSSGMTVARAAGAAMMIEPLLQDTPDGGKFAMAPGCPAFLWCDALLMTIRTVAMRAPYTHLLIE